MESQARYQDSLDGVTQSILAELQMESRFEIEKDIPEGMSLPVEGRALGELIRLLLEQSSTELAEGAEISIIGWESSDCFEIEIADSGPCVQERDCTVPDLAKLLGAELFWQDCPQGGAAVTVRFYKMRHRQAA